MYFLEIFYALSIGTHVFVQSDSNPIHVLMVLSTRHARGSILDQHVLETFTFYSSVDENLYHVHLSIFIESP